MSAHHAPHNPMWKKLLSLPMTHLGWFSVGLAARFVVLLTVNAAVFLPAPGIVPWREALSRHRAAIVCNRWWDCCSDRADTTP